MTATHAGLSRAERRLAQSQPQSLTRTPHSVWAVPVSPPAAATPHTTCCTSLSPPDCQPTRHPLLFHNDLCLRPSPRPLQPPHLSAPSITMLRVHRSAARRFFSTSSATSTKPPPATASSRAVAADAEGDSEFARKVGTQSSRNTVRSAALPLSFARLSPPCWPLLLPLLSVCCVAQYTYRSNDPPHWVGARQDLPQLVGMAALGAFIVLAVLASPSTPDRARKH